MRNVWKGLVVGACTGAGVGLVVDAVYGSGRIGRELAGQGRDKLADAHLGTRAHDVANDLADSLRSDVAPAAKEALVTASKTVKDEVAPRVDDASRAVRHKIAG